MAKNGTSSIVAITGFIPCNLWEKIGTSSLVAITGFIPCNLWKNGTAWFFQQKFPMAIQVVDDGIPFSCPQLWRSNSESCSGILLIFPNLFNQQGKKRGNFSQAFSGSTGKSSSEICGKKPFTMAAKDFRIAHNLYIPILILRLMSELKLLADHFSRPF